MNKTRTPEDTKKIVERIYQKKSFVDIARAFDTTSPSLYRYVFRLFGNDYTCEEHNYQHFQTEECEACAKKMEQWYANALEIVDTLGEYTLGSMRYFTRKEDLYLLNNAYDKTLDEIAKELDRSVISISYRIIRYFGSPSCDTHHVFTHSCRQCQENVKMWRKEGLQKLRDITYRKKKMFTEKDVKKQYKIQRLRQNLSEFVFEDYYDDIIHILTNIEIPKEGYQVCAMQLYRIFIEDSLYHFDVEKDDFSVFDMEKYFSITPNIKITTYLQPYYKEFINPSFKPLPDYKKFFLRDAYTIHTSITFFDADTTFFKKLYDFYKRVYTKIPLEGLACALIYIFEQKKYHRRQDKHTQKEIGALFNITDVTLRKRICIVEKIVENSTPQCRVCALARELLALLDKKTENVREEEGVSAERESKKLDDIICGIIRAKKTVDISYITEFLNVEKNEVLKIIFHLLGTNTLRGELCNEDSVFKLSDS